MGAPPFRGANEYQTFKKIISLSYEIPAEVPADFSKMISKILKLEPSARPKLIELMNDPIFCEIDFTSIQNTVPPTMSKLIPLVSIPVVFDNSNNNSSSNFDLNGMEFGLNDMIFSPEKFDEGSASSQDSVDPKTPHIENWRPSKLPEKTEIVKIGTLKKVFDSY